jgi:predicted restriction endonuclease
MTPLSKDVWQLMQVPQDVWELVVDAHNEGETMQYAFNDTPRRMPSHRTVWLHWVKKIATPNHKTCMLCGVEDGENNLDRAHILPRCYGGDDVVENLLLLCFWCHRRTEVLKQHHWAKLFSARGWS